MDNRIFIAAPFFFLRVPLWSLEDYNRILSKKNWIEEILYLYETNQLLREAIAIASPSLYRSLEQKPLKDPKQAAISLFNYVTRMATRATPFGLFSFVTTGLWSQQTKADIDLSQVRKYARPDMEWLFLLVQKFYNDTSVFSSLPVQSNPLIRVNQERCYLKYIRYIEKEKIELPKAISIRATLLVKKILEFSKELIQIETLWKRLQEIMPSLDEEKTKVVIKTLLDQQVLLPGILPSLLSNSPFTDLLSQLPETSEIESIAQSIHTYNQCSLGKGEANLQKLQKNMETIAQTKTFLQVDAGYRSQSIHLFKNVAQELEKTLVVLWKMSSSHPPLSTLNSYLGKFIEKYGTHRTVPLLELLSQERGLGPLENCPASTPSPTNFSQQWEKWLSHEWQKCLDEKRKEIILTETLIDDLFVDVEEPPPDPDEALLSLDVFCKVFADSPEQIDQGNFLILLSQLNWRGGSTLGRFLPFLGEDIQTQLGDYFRKEEALDQDSRFVELSYWPHCIRNANVAIQPCLRPYRLDIEEKKRGPTSIALEDIYVGATRSRFYLTLKNGDYEIVPCIGNLLNSKLAPAPMQFMREVNLTRHKLVHPFSLEKVAKNSIFFPRVRFQKTILSPAQWNFDAFALSKASLNEITSLFTLWADRWSLPSRFFLVRDDQHLLLDRGHPAHLEEIAFKLKKGESLQFIEEISHPWIKSERGCHFSEIVASFLKNPVFSKKKKSFVPCPHVPVSFEKRWKLPGSEWLFIKLYMGEEEIEKFLVYNLALFTEYLDQEIGILGWFFVRYDDPEKHVRFRVQLKSPELLLKALDLLNEAFKVWMHEGLIKNVVISCYEREIERYGGLDLIETAETIFCADSRAAIFLLQAFLNKKISIPLSVFRSLSVINFLKEFGLDQEQMISLLHRQGNRNELAGFREHKRQLLSLTAALESSLGESDEVMIIKSASQLRASAVRAFQFFAQHLPSNKQFEVYNSLLHLHCNRLGCGLSEEQQACLYARHTLLQMKHLQVKQYPEPVAKLSAVTKSSF